MSEQALVNTNTVSQSTANPAAESSSVEKKSLSKLIKLPKHFFRIILLLFYY
ncbi:MAG: hypothetical protein IPK14_05185 [Blastocatellia bacterium]|nr:hypothetical protein [Blastocatellia bacterium]